MTTVDNINIDTEEVVFKKNDKDIQQSRVAIPLEDGKNDDQYDAFGKYLAIQLRSMNEHDAHYSQFKIQEVLFKMKSYSSNSLMLSSK